MFGADSRYAKLKPITVIGANGKPVQIVPIRFIGSADSVLSRRIRQDDRPDLLAYEFYKEPQLFWRIADANEVMRPGELVSYTGSLIGVPTKD
jgi:nucleoid-associated protein YgaU